MKKYFCKMKLANGKVIDETFNSLNYEEVGNSILSFIKGWNEIAETRDKNYIIYTMFIVELK